MLPFVTVSTHVLSTLSIHLLRPHPRVLVCYLHRLWVFVVAYIRARPANATRAPFFAYVAFQEAHAPFQVPGRFENQYNHSFKPQNVWSGMVSAVDETVKNITNALKQASLWDNT